MKIVFAGHSGVAKRAAVSRIVDFYLTKRGLHQDLARTEQKAHILPICVEDEVERQRHAPITTILDSFNDELRAATWDEALEQANDRVIAANPDHVILLIHLSLYRHSNFFTFTNWHQIRRFSPDMIVTIIDDVYDVWARIRQETQRYPDRTLITIKELFEWRSVEVFLAELLSRNLNLVEGRVVPHFVVPVKHPLIMFDKLLFEPEVARIYASYPITHVRANPEAVQEVNDARARLHEEFTVFDPVTIDERILQAKLVGVGSQTDGAPEELCLELSDRWPLNWAQCAVDPSLLYPIRIPRSEVRALGTQREGRWTCRTIDDNIRWRDFALIKQAQGILAYRPCYGRQYPSTGVTRELIHATDMRMIPARVYSPMEDGENVSPFAPSADIDTDFEMAITNLKRAIQEGA
jgi:adenylate kinase